MDNMGTSADQTCRESSDQFESGLAEFSSAPSKVTIHPTPLNIHKTANKGDISHSTDFPVKKTHSSSTKGDGCSVLDNLRSPSVSVNFSELNPVENGSGEICARLRVGSPSKLPSSILKNKSIDEPYPMLVSSNIPQQMPVSILKRKTVQDEAGSVSAASSAYPPPVTFSPSVLEQTGSNGKRQGILKKRSSLDESEVLRRRSCSPDMAGWDPDSSLEFRPILKNQRRSSMQELVRRTQSPDPHPQSILKKRTSPEDEVEEHSSCSPEPQGILKRKSATSSNSSSSSTSPHISIATSVIMNVAGLEPGADILPLDGSTEHVRPILKKKSSSEDNNTADSSSSEAPKPILKKKTSVEVDDLEERPMKPILKSSRKSSQEEQTGREAAPIDSPVRCLILRSHSARGSDSASGSDCEVVRPILKQPGSDRSSQDRSASPRNRLSFSDDSEQHVVKVEKHDSAGSAIGSGESRNGSPNGEGAAHRTKLKQSSVSTVNSPSSIDSELNAIFNKRRSFEVAVDVDSECVHHRRSPVVMETAHSRQRPVSVAERVLSMENFLSQEVGSARQTGAIPKKPGSLRPLRDRERFRTQPITLQELNASAR
jgi:supervillin